MGLFGPSGAGKSTLLNMIAGLTVPDSGYLMVDGDILFDSEKRINVPAHQRRIAVVFQESRLFPHLDVAANLNYGLKLLKPAEQQFGYQQIVELLEIRHLLKQKPHQLSGGEKQRVAMGRALLSSPRLLLMDEPLASLDVRLKQQILPFLRRVKEETRIPMLYVSHAINEVLYLTSDLAIMDRGQLLDAGPFHEVMRDERVLAMAQALGLENLLQVEVTAHDQQLGYTTAQVGGQLIHLPVLDAAVGELVCITVAASNVALANGRVSGVSIQNQLQGKVSKIHQVGNRVLVTVDIGANLLAEVTTRAVKELQIVEGATIYCLVKTQSIRPLVVHPA